MDISSPVYDISGVTFDVRSTCPVVTGLEVGGEGGVLSCRLSSQCAECSAKRLIEKGLALIHNFLSPPSYVLADDFSSSSILRARVCQKLLGALSTVSAMLPFGLCGVEWPRIYRVACACSGASA